MNDKLTHLLKKARSAPHEASSQSDETLPPGLATRIAARWTASDERSLHIALFERITACCLVPVITAWAILAWTAPAQAEPDLIELLYHAELVVEPASPF